MAVQLTPFSSSSVKGNVSGGISLTEFPSSVSKKVPTVSDGSVLKAAPKETFLGKVFDVIKKPIQPLLDQISQDTKAKNSLAYTISQDYGIKYDDARKNIDDITKELGIRGVPTTKELIGTGFTLAAGAGLATAPLATLAGLAMFSFADKSVKEALNLASSLVTKKPYEFGSVKEYSAVLPVDSPDILKDMVDIAGFISSAKLTHVGFKAGEKYLPKVKEKITKDIITEYKLPDKVYVKAEDVWDWQTGKTKIDPKIEELLIKSNLSNTQRKSAVKDGLTLEIPAERITTISDKPYFSKIKEFLRLKPETEVLRSSFGETRVAPFGLLESKNVIPKNVNLTSFPVEQKNVVLPEKKVEINKPAEVVAKDLIESKTKTELVEKLQNIFGRYEELDNLENVATYEKPNEKLAIANDYMADVEYAANQRDYEETTALLKEVQERQKMMEKKKVKSLEVPQIKTVENISVEGFSPEENVSVVKQPIERIGNETLDEAIKRKVGYQIDNGKVKLEQDINGWRATIYDVGGKKQVIMGLKKQQVLNEVFNVLYPNSGVEKVNILNKPQVKSEKLTPYDTAEIIRARKIANSLPETININTPERISLREKIVNDLYGDGAKIKEKRVDLVIGSPASGKSTRLVDPLAEKHGSLVIDSDQVKKILPEFQNGIGASSVHKESAKISDEMILSKALGNGDNIVFPRLGKNEKTMTELIDLFNDNGYNVHLHYMDLPENEAAKRVVTRFNETGRFVDPNYILNEVDGKPKRVYNIIKNKKGVLTYEEYSNDVPFGEAPKLIERGENKESITNGRIGIQRQFGDKNIEKGAEFSKEIDPKNYKSAEDYLSAAKDSGIFDNLKSLEEISNKEIELMFEWDKLNEKQKKTSGVAKSIEAKAVEQGLIDKGFETLAEFEGTTRKEQAEKVAEMINTDFENVRAIIRGEKDLPAGVRSAALISGVEDYVKNLILLSKEQKLAKTESGLDFGGEMENQYQSFVKLFNDPRLKSKKTRESVFSEDVAKFKSELKRLGIDVSVDNMLYTQEMSDNAVFDKFKERLSYENAAKLVGKENAKLFSEKSSVDDLSSTIMYELANSPLASNVSAAASELSMAGMREKDSATIKLQEIKKARMERAKKRTGREKKELEKKLKSETTVKLSKEENSWDKFLSEIIC